MNTQKIALDYAQATHLQTEAEDRLNLAFGALGSDNMVMSLAEPIFRAYTKLIQEILGPKAWDWLIWWMYETDSGTKPMEFTLNEVDYCPTQLTFDEFWNLVCE